MYDFFVRDKGYVSVVVFSFTIIYPISFVYNFKLVKYIARMDLIHGINIQSACAIWDEPIKKACH
jgi:hypothetical protein